VIGEIGNWTLLHLRFESRELKLDTPERGMARKRPLADRFAQRLSPLGEGNYILDGPMSPFEGGR